MSETTTKWTYSWIDEPPIVPVTYADFKARKKAFDESLTSWGTMGGDTDLSEKMNDHAGSAGFIARVMKKENTPTKPIFEYRVAGAPAALMMLHIAGDFLEIKNLFTHPGTQNAGGIMIEFALNQGLVYISKGLPIVPNVLILTSYNEASTSAYAALGFVQDGKEMILKAEESDKWDIVAQKWKLKKFKNDKYLDAKLQTQ